MKMDLAKSHGAANVFQLLSRRDSSAQFERLQKETLTALISWSRLSEVLRSLRTRSTTFDEVADFLSTVVMQRKTVSPGHPARSSETRSPSSIHSHGCTSFPPQLTISFPARSRWGESISKTFKLNQRTECMEAMKDNSTVKTAITFDRGSREVEQVCIFGER